MQGGMGWQVNSPPGSVRINTTNSHKIRDNFKTMYPSSAHWGRAGSIKVSFDPGESDYILQFTPKTLPVFTLTICRP